MPASGLLVEAPLATVSSAASAWRSGVRGKRFRPGGFGIFLPVVIFLPSTSPLREAADLLQADSQALSCQA